MIHGMSRELVTITSCIPRLVVAHPQATPVAPVEVCATPHGRVGVTHL